MQLFLWALHIRRIIGRMTTDIFKWKVIFTQEMSQIVVQGCVQVIYSIDKMLKSTTEYSVISVSNNNYKMFNMWQIRRRHNNNRLEWSIDISLSFNVTAMFSWFLSILHTRSENHLIFHFQLTRKQTTIKC